MRIPKLCRHKGQRRGYINWRRREIYLPGTWPDDAVKPPREIVAAYRTLIGRLLADIPQSQPVELVRDLTVAGLCADYGEWCQSRYSPSEATNKSAAWSLLCQHWGTMPVKDFGSAHLYAIQDALAKSGRTRQGVNKLIGMIRSVFFWGLDRIPDFPTGVCERLRRVQPLRRGSTTAPESIRRLGVGTDVIDRFLDHAHEPIKTMVQLQRMCGLRPKEVCTMTLAEIDRSDPLCWWYRPAHHKKAWREKDRAIPIVRQAQALLLPHLSANPSAPVFQPVTRWGNKRQSAKPYLVSSYDRAIMRICKIHNIPHWSANQLRKAAAQIIVETLSREHAAALLGHDYPLVTSRHYLAQAAGLAVEGAEKIAEVISFPGKTNKNQNSR